MKLLKTAIAFALILSEVTAFEDDMPRDGEFRLSPPQSLVGMRIVNGAPSPFMPEWMSYLYKPNYMYNFGCGATVIGKNLVMTAARKSIDTSFCTHPDLTQNLCRLCTTRC